MKAVLVPLASGITPFSFSVFDTWRSSSQVVGAFRLYLSKISRLMNSPRVCEAKGTA